MRGVVVVSSDTVSGVLCSRLLIFIKGSLRHRTIRPICQTPSELLDFLLLSFYTDPHLYLFSENSVALHG